MCGIIGVINFNKFVKKDLDLVFSDMFFANQLRGTDGGGVFWYDTRDDNYAIVKDADLGEVFKNKHYKTALNWIEKLPFLVGHNRAATRGKVKTENNHPFDAEHLILVHNGTMSYLPKDFTKDVDVDSHAIANMISADSVEAFMKDSFGAYALTWFDKRSRQLNLLRNKDRPLSIVYFKEFALLSSEPDLARWCGKRRGYDVIEVEDISVHTLYQWDAYAERPVKTDLAHVTKYTPPAPTFNYGQRSGVWVPEDYDDWEVGDNGYQRKQLTGQSVIPFTSLNERSVDAKRKFYKEINVWDHYKTVNPKKDKSVKFDPTTFQLKVGDPLMFSLDSLKLEGVFATFVGNIPRYPIASYEVRGSIAVSKEIADNGPMHFLQGTIMQIHVKDDKVTVWVKDVFITTTLDPAYNTEEAFKRANEKK